MKRGMGSRFHILIVEDEPLIVEVLQATLELDYRVSSVNSGASPKGAITLWVEVPPGQWSVGPVAGGRCGWVTGRIEAPRQRPLLAVERIDGP
jgi:hypothetical protein